MRIGVPCWDAVVAVAVAVVVDIAARVGWVDCGCWRIDYLFARTGSGLGRDGFAGGVKGGHRGSRFGSRLGSCRLLLRLARIGCAGWASGGNSLGREVFASLT